jgi:uncharacterized repeat protein (TIGR03803 family)
MQAKQQFRNLISRTISRVATAPLAIAFVLAFMATQAAMFSATTYAQTVTFTTSYSCYVNDPGCPQANLSISHYTGVASSDLVTIATVNSNVPGYTQPVPINGGSLSWTSAPASMALCVGDGCTAVFQNPGGSASITGSVFGLPNGTVLLTGSFQGGGSGGVGPHGTAQSYSGGIDVSYINPAILANLGMPGLPNHGTGVLSDEWGIDVDSGLQTFTVSVTFTPGAQCASGFSGSGHQSLGQTAKHSAGNNNFKILHNFSASGDGALPMGPLSIDQAGNLYGTTQQGGSGNGTVFRLKQVQSDWVLNPLYTFSGGNDGADPVSGVTIGPNGILYGTTYWQGSSGFGTAFSLKPAAQAPKSALEGWSETVLHFFAGGNGSGNGAYPYGNLVFDPAGNLYGTTLTGGNNGWGDVFQLTPNGAGGWTEKVLFSFINSYRGGLEGASPYAGVVFDQLGNLYGTTWGGGNGPCGFQSGCGTVFQLTPSAVAWKENVLYDFQNGSDGADPAGGLIVDASGNLYGATNDGGSAGGGTVFELTPAGNGNWTYTLIYSFTGGSCGQGCGCGPLGNLTMDGAGNLYGTTLCDGANNAGSVFKLSPSKGAWMETDLYDFSGSDGANPMGGVTLDSSGNLFGTTAYGGTYSCGVAYEITP